MSSYKALRCRKCYTCPSCGIAKNGRAFEEGEAHCRDCAKLHCEVCDKDLPRQAFSSSQVRNRALGQNPFLRCSSCHTCARCSEEKQSVALLQMTSIALRVQIKRRVKLVTDAESRSHEITSTSLYCKMLESMDGTKFVYSAKTGVYHRWIYKHIRAMVAGKKAIKHLCQTRFIATKKGEMHNNVVPRLYRKTRQHPKSSQCKRQFEMHLPKRKDKRPLSPTDK